MSFAPQQPPGPNRQERQSEMEAITLQQERDEEERIRLAEEEAKNKAERERLLKEQQARTLAAQQAAEATAFSANTTSKPNEIEETVKIKTNPITGEQTTTLEEKVPAGVPTSIGPVSPNMEGGAAPIPLTPTATTVKPVRPDMEGGAAPVAMGAGTLTPTVGEPGSVPTLQDTLGAANEAGATVTPGTTPATSGVDGQADTTEQSFLDKTIDFLKSREKPDVSLTQPTMPGITSAKLGGAESTAAGGATLRPSQMQPTAPTPAVSPMQGGMQPAIQQPVAPQPVVSPQQMMPQGGGMLAPGADQPGPAIPQIGGMQPVSYQVPDNDAYAMARQQNYPMDELGNYYAPNGQVISPGTTMADLTSASTQTPVSPGGFAPTPNWTAQSGEMFVPDKQYYPLVGGQQFDSPAQAYMAEKEAERRQIGDGIDGVDSPEVELSKVIAVDSELPEVPKTQAELDALKAKNIADGGTEVGAIVEVDDSKDTINAQLTKETDNAVANRNVNGLATLLESDKFTPEQKDIIKENIKVITKSSVTEQRDKVLLEKTLADAATGDKKAKKIIANALEGKAPRGETKEEGSFFLGLFYSAIGQKGLAAEQFRKAQGGTTVVALTDSDGNFAGRAKKASDGSLVAGSAVGIDGNVMSETQVAGLQYLKSDVNKINKVSKASMVYMPGTGKKGDADYVEAAGYQVTLNPNGTIKKVLDSTGTQVTDPILAKNIITQYAKTGSGTTKATSTVTKEFLEGSDGLFYQTVSTDDGQGNITMSTRNVINGKPLPEGATILGRVRDEAQIAKLQKAAELRGNLAEENVRRRLITLYGEENIKKLVAWENSLGRTANTEERGKYLDSLALPGQKSVTGIINDGTGLDKKIPAPDVGTQSIGGGEVQQSPDGVYYDTSGFAVDKSGKPIQNPDPAKAEGADHLAQRLKEWNEDQTADRGNLSDQKKLFNKKVAEEIVPKGEKGQRIANIRKQMVDIILQDTNLAGVFQGQQGNTITDLLRDVAGNIIPANDASERIKTLSLTKEQKAAVSRLQNLALQIAPLTLKDNAGGGAISQPEHELNAKANVDLTRSPLYAGLSLIGYDMFQRQINRAKMAFANENEGTLQTIGKFNKSWMKEKQNYLDQYMRVTKARIDYINKYGGIENDAAVKQAFKQYPVPGYANGKIIWEKYAKEAARPPLSSFSGGSN